MKCLCRYRWGGGGVALTHSQPDTRRRWVTSTTLWPLYPLERPGIHCTGGWVGLGAGLDGTENLGLVPGTVQPVASCRTEYAIPAAWSYITYQNMFSVFLGYCLDLLGHQSLSDATPYLRRTDKSTAPLRKPENSQSLIFRFYSSSSAFHYNPLVSCAHPVVWELVWSPRYVKLNFNNLRVAVCSLKHLETIVCA